MGANIAEKYLTIDEYIEFEKTSDSKHEYRDGKLFEIAGAKLPHNLLSGEIFQFNIIFYCALHKIRNAER